MSNNKFILDRKFADLIESLGISIAEVLKKSNLPEDLFSHQIPSLTAIEYIKFMEKLYQVILKLGHSETETL